MNPIEIQANEEGMKMIKSLCDIALKTGGLNNLPYINQVLASLKPIPHKEQKSADDK